MQNVGRDLTNKSWLACFEREPDCKQIGYQVCTAFLSSGATFVAKSSIAVSVFACGRSGPEMN